MPYQTRCCVYYPTGIGVKAAVVLCQALSTTQHQYCCKNVQFVCEPPMWRAAGLMKNSGTALRLKSGQSPPAAASCWAQRGEPARLLAPSSLPWRRMWFSVRLQVWPGMRPCMRAGVGLGMGLPPSRLQPGRHPMRCCFARDRCHGSLSDRRRRLAAAAAAARYRDRGLQRCFCRPGRGLC